MVNRLNTGLINNNKSMGKTLLKSQNSFPVTTNVLHISQTAKTNHPQLTILNK